MKSFDMQVADWARTKPADMMYPYSIFCGCALFQFLTEKGYSVFEVYGLHWRDTEGRNHWFNQKDHLSMDGLGSALSEEPHTFGALADRLNA